MEWLNDISSSRTRNWIQILAQICLEEYNENIQFVVDIGDTKPFVFDYNAYENGDYIVSKNSSKLKIIFMRTLAESLYVKPLGEKNEDIHDLLEMSTMSEPNSFTDRKKIIIYGLDHPRFPYHFHYKSNVQFTYILNFDFEFKTVFSVFWVV